MSTRLLAVARKLLQAGTLAITLVGGCTVGPDFHPPVVKAPPLWGPERTDVRSRTVVQDVNPQWWRSFHDPLLVSLVDRLVAQNLDLRSAAERVLQGRAQRQATAAQGLPQISEQSSFRHNRGSPTGFLSLIQPAPGAPFNYDIWQNALNSSWDLDLFGRVRRGVEAADAETLASVENRRGIALSVLAELAQDYLQLRGVQAQRVIAERNLRLAQQNSKLVRDRFGNGVATTLDMALAQSQQATFASTLSPLRTQEATLINAIGLLLAQPPRALATELTPRANLPPVPPVVPVGLPSTLVRRRPDVREAEARLHAATAQTGVATANFYPDISLTANANLDGRRLTDAFSLPSRAFELGPTFSVPLFQGGRLTGELRLRESQQREAAINFQQTVLRAWQEVDDALTAYAEAQRQRVDISESARQNAIALRAARQRYTEGAADFLNVISANAQVLQSENDLATSDTRIATDLVMLYRALGGGWEVTDSAVPPPSSYDRLLSTIQP